MLTTTATSLFVRVDNCGDGDGNDVGDDGDDDDNDCDDPRYVDSYCNKPDQILLSAQEMLKPAVEVIVMFIMVFIMIVVIIIIITIQHDHPICPRDAQTCCGGDPSSLSSLSSL